MKTGFEKTLLESGEIMKRGATALLENAGKAVALLTGIVAALVMFTEIGFTDVTARSFTPTLLLMLIATYVIYFSMEDAGERLGRDSDEFRAAKERFDAAREKIGGKDVPSLRDFCARYADAELAFRRENALTAAGIAEEDPARAPTRREKRLLKRARRLRRLPLSPVLLLSDRETRQMSELSNPERGKFLRLLCDLLPTTLCMIVTVSVVLSGKEGLDAAGVIEGLLKLSSLPLIAFRGYAKGYGFVKNRRSLWIETKAKLLENFLGERETT